LIIDLKGIVNSKGIKCCASERNNLLSMSLETYQMHLQMINELENGDISSSLAKKSFLKYKI